MGQPNGIVDSSRLGVIILTAFALVWVIAAMALSSVPFALSIAAAVVVVVATITINVVAASRHFAPVDEAELPLAPRQRRTVFVATNIIQAVLFSVLISVCIALNELAYIPLLGSVIVGGHLIPIGLSFGEVTFIVGGGLLVLTGGGGIVASSMLFTTSTFSTGVVSLTNAVVLVALAGVQIRLYSNAS